MAINNVEAAQIDEKVIDSPAFAPLFDKYNLTQVIVQKGNPVQIILKIEGNPQQPVAEDVRTSLLADFKDLVKSKIPNINLENGDFAISHYPSARMAAETKTSHSRG